MLRSMTGYGHARFEWGGYEGRVELKALNSRYLDLSVRLPKAFSEQEIPLRNRLSTMMVRGKVHVNVEVVPTQSDSRKMSINEQVLVGYVDHLKALLADKGVDVSHALPMLLAMDDVQVRKDEPDTQLWQEVEKALAEAWKHFDDFRLREGEGLYRQLKEYGDTIAASLEKIDAQKDLRPQKIRESLTEKLQQVMQSPQFDPQRLEQEMMFYVERLDITEEVVRLRVHLHEYQASLKEKESGKKLNFLSQEMGREINTIGSKSNDVDMQIHVVRMKEELEKIKEQIQNVV